MLEAFFVAFSVIVLFPRQVIVIWFVPERAVLRLGNLKCHRAICNLGPSNRAVEPTKYLCHLCDILGQAAKLLSELPTIFCNGGQYQSE